MFYSLLCQCHGQNLLFCHQTTLLATQPIVPSHSKKSLNPPQDTHGHIHLHLFTVWMGCDIDPNQLGVVEFDDRDWVIEVEEQRQHNNVSIIIPSKFTNPVSF
ncbi:hypothetical protein VNO77_10159 [Canavalia gladiata]|uniref:Uncharacterized protein n=1 Tax=Canavalia gladiata TaxID=3824 RepID=A0AAN9MAN7_CANGL